MNQIVAALFALFILFGGILGWVKESSLISLIMSLVFTAIFVISIIMMYYNLTAGSWLAIVAIAMLGIFFSVRFFHTRRFFPPGFYVLLSIAALLLLIFRIIKYRR